MEVARSTRPPGAPLPPLLSRHRVLLNFANYAGLQPDGIQGSALDLKSPVLRDLPQHGFFNRACSRPAFNFTAASYVKKRIKTNTKPPEKPPGPMMSSAATVWLEGIVDPLVGQSHMNFLGALRPIGWSVGLDFE